MEKDGPTTPQARLEHVRAQADDLLAQGKAPAARELYRSLHQELPAGSAEATEAAFHEALVLESELKDVDVAVATFIRLARAGHEGARKCVLRHLEAQFSIARDSRVPERRVAFQKLRELVVNAPDDLSIVRDVRGWLSTTAAGLLMEEGDLQYSAGSFDQAAASFEEAGHLAQIGKVVALSQKAFGRAAGIYWYNRMDPNGALRALAGLGGLAAQHAPARLILGRVTESLVEDLRMLVRRGERRDAFRRLREVYPLLPAGEARTEELTRLYLSELCSHYLSALDERVASLDRRMDGQSLNIARRSAPGAAYPVERMDEVACSLTLYALNDEKERVVQIRERARAAELEVLKVWSPAEYILLQEKAAKDKTLVQLLDRIHMLSLERMHYRTKLRLETKDALASLLPTFLANLFTDDVYTRIQSLEMETALHESRFWAEAYQKREGGRES
jgi:hypothetical protein